MPGRWPWLLLVLAAASAAAGHHAGHRPEFTLYLVRHAEKTAAVEDPGLTEAGSERSRWLAMWLADKRLRSIWSSDYLRSRATAQPAAEAMDMDLRLYDPRQLEAFARTLLQQAETALVVGHSNTTPQLASLLCECPVAPMEDSEHDRLIVVVSDAHGRRLQEYDQRELMGLPRNP